MSPRVDDDPPLTPMGADNQVGIEAISYDQTITFTLYGRVVLPLDGYVFWLNANGLSPSTLQKLAGANPVPPNSVEVKGSLHYATDSNQEQDANIDKNHVVFTSQTEIEPFNLVQPGLSYIATSVDGIRFGFSSRGSFYEQANEWHYLGDAIYPVMNSQIIDDPGSFDATQLIVSNSLPAWLAMNIYAPVYPVPLTFPAVTLFPSFLAPANESPPYGTVHIEPESTVALQGAPYLDQTLSHRAIATERVVVTLYGCNNDIAQRFLDCVLQYSLDTELFGIMNMPAVRDDKRTQNELLILAQKKRIVFDVSYYQTSIRNIARQLIEQAVTTYYPRPGPPLPPPPIP